MKTITSPKHEQSNSLSTNHVVESCLCSSIQAPALVRTGRDLLLLPLLPYLHSVQMSLDIGSYCLRLHMVSCL